MLETDIDDVNAVIEGLKSTSESYHFRVSFGDKGYDSSVIDFISKKFKRYTVAYEEANKPHVHVYCEVEDSQTRVIRQTFIQKFPEYKGTGQYYLKKCKSNDWQNLKYTVKSKDIKSTNMSLELIEKAKEESFEKPKTGRVPIRNNKWLEAKIEFQKKVSCGLLTKHYTNEHLLEFCIEWYGTQSPFNETHIENLFNFISINMERTKESRKAELKANLKFKLNI